MPPNKEKGSDWQAVIGRSLAYICLHESDMKDATVTKKAKFLKGLGLLGIPGQGDSDFEVIPIKIPKLI